MRVDTTPEATITRLTAAIPVIYGALRHGVSVANAYFSKQGWEQADEPWLYCHLVRAHAKERLGGGGVVADLEDVEGVSLPMSGLLIHHGFDVVKIRKAEDGVVPRPGSVIAGQFYEQLSALPGLEETNNLLILWDAPGGQLSPLVLTRPLGSAHRHDLLVEWKVELPETTTSQRRVDDLDELAPLADPSAETAARAS